METLEKAQEKIQKICETLRKKTLEPALLQVDTLLEEAKKKAQSIILEAEEEAASLIKKAKEEIYKEQNVFHASLSQATKQTLETLRQEIENKLFLPELEKLINKEMVKPQVIADIIKVIIQAIEKEGLSANLEIIIPKAVPATEVTKVITNELKDKELHLGDFVGGAKVKIVEKNMVLEITDASVLQLVASYVRKDFRDHLFVPTQG